MFNNIN